jgi:hypothetical protein
MVLWNILKNIFIIIVKRISLILPKNGLNFTEKQRRGEEEDEDEDEEEEEGGREDDASTFESQNRKAGSTKI